MPNAKGTLAQAARTARVGIVAGFEICPLGLGERSTRAVETEVLRLAPGSEREATMPRRWFVQPVSCLVDIKPVSSRTRVGVRQQWTGGF